MVDATKQIHIGNRRPDSLGAWRFARLSHSVCAESMCFDIPRDDDMCRPHAAKARQAKRALDE